MKDRNRAYKPNGSGGGRREKRSLTSYRDDLSRAYRDSKKNYIRMALKNYKDFLVVHRMLMAQKIKKFYQGM